MEPLQTELDQSDIQVAAYDLWQRRGCPFGTPEADWFRAEVQIREQSLDVADRPPLVAAAEVVGSVLGSVAGLAASVGNLIHSDKATESD